MMNSHRRTSARSNPDSLIGQDTSPDIRVQLETLRGGSSAAKWSTREDTGLSGTWDPGRVSSVALQVGL